MKKVIVIGAGPAGMMAAIRSARLGNSVLLLEKNPSAGKKLLLTGKGRCNITNAASMEKFISRFSKNAQFLRDAFKCFFVEDLFLFFKQHGLELKQERQNRVFPVTDSAKSVLLVLKKELALSGVDIQYNSTVKDVVVKGAKVSGVVVSDEKNIIADKVILATGGASYPFTGSTGDGYDMARKCGHKISTIRPALVALQVKQLYVKELEGLSLKNIRLVFKGNKKKVLSEIGELLFTERGVSGPLVVSMSADMLEIFERQGCLELEIDIKPALDIEQLGARILREINARPRLTVYNLLKSLMPVRIIGTCLSLSGINKNTRASDLKTLERKKIISFLKSWHFDITGSAGFEKAMVTRGGVSLKEIDPKTMQSRIVKNLYFAGEVIDVDADTGGFNLQAAFSTGNLAGYGYI